MRIKNYLKTALIFTTLEATIAYPHRVSPLLDWNKTWTKWNWSWVYCLIAGFLIGERLLRSPKRAGYTRRAGLSLILNLAYVAIVYGYLLPIDKVNHDLSTYGFINW